MRINLKNIFILFLLFFGVVLFAAEREGDKNLSVYSSDKPSHQSKLDFYLSKGWKFRSLKPDSAIYYLNKAIDLSVYLRSTSKMAQAYNFLGVVFRNLGEPDSSYYFYKKALEFASLANDSVQIAYSYNNTGSYFLFRGQYFLALEHVYRADMIFERLNSPRGLGYTRQQLGNIYMGFGDYEKAEKFYLSSLNFRKKINSESGIWKAKRHLARVYLELGDIDRTLKLVDEILPHFKEAQMWKSITLSYLYRAKASYLFDDYKTSLKWLEKALEASKNVGCNICPTEIHLLTAKNKFALNEPDLALEHLEKAARLSNNKQYYAGYIKTLSEFINIYSYLAIPDKIYEYTEQLLALKNSLNNEEAKIRDEEFKKLFLTNKLKHKNIVLSNEVKNKQRIIFLIVISSILVLVFVTVVFYQNKKISERTKQLTKALDDKNKFFGIIAHDLKNPFNSLLGYADMLLVELEDVTTVDRSDVKSGIKQMRVSAQKLLDMVEDLLQWARSQTGKMKYVPEVVNINDIILETVSYFFQSAKIKGVDLKVNLTPHFKCYCDKQMIATALRNLITNSIKFCNAGDTVKVYATKDKSENNLIVHVEDTGVGVSKDKLDNLFKVNYTKKGTAGETGTGLGLSLVKEMVTRNKGEIFVTSEPGKGTKFWFTLPLAE